MNKVPVKLLKPHAKNKEYFPERPPDELWKEIMNDIRKNGIINPLIVTADYTVLAGHLRLEAAKEVGLTRVPVIIMDIPPDSDEAVELLIKDNLLRRHLSDMQVARLIKVLKERYNIRRGGDRRENSEKAKGDFRPLKLEDVSKMLNMSERHVKELDKLNDLILEIQKLVDSGKLGSSAAYELAFLSPETQKQLHNAYGERLAEIKTVEAKKLRRQLEEEMKVEVERQAARYQEKIERFNKHREQMKNIFEAQEKELKKDIADLQEKLRESMPAEEAAALKKELETKELELAQERINIKKREKEFKEQISEFQKKIEELKNNPKVVEKVVEKAVPDPMQEMKLKAAQKRVMQLTEELQKALEDRESRQADIERLQKEKRRLEKRVERLEKTAKARRELEKDIVEVPLKKELEKISSLGADLLLLLNKVKENPDAVRKLVKAMRSAGSSDGSIMAAAGQFDASMLYVNITGVLKQLAVRAHETAEYLEKSLKEGQQLHLKVVSGKGGREDEKRKKEKTNG